MATGGYHMPDTEPQQPMMQGQYGGHTGGDYATQPHVGGGFGGGYATDPHAQAGGYGGGAGHGYDAGAAPTGGYGGASGMDGLQGVDKSFKWNLAFFIGAVCTLAAGVIATFYFIFHSFQVSTWSPATFFSGLCLTFFGFMMVIVDLPVKHDDPRLRRFRDSVYTFALFMTRFTGRGFWYLFLGSHCWVALFDDHISSFFAIIFTSYLCLIGVAALYKGFTLSKKLHDTQQRICANQVDPQRFLHKDGPRGEMLMHKEDFKQMVLQQSPDANLFTDEEITYVINALSFRPDHDNDLSLEEINYWLKPSGGPGESKFWQILLV